MNHRSRFAAVMDYAPLDRLPIYYFGQWDETLARWQQEGLGPTQSVAEVTGMDQDWEEGMWDYHRLVNPWPISDEPRVVLEETEDWRLVRTELGSVVRMSKVGSSIPQTVIPALEPTRASWERFKRFLDPRDPRRYPEGWQARAHVLNQRDRVATFMAGSLYGLLRDWMGVEGISFLMYDEPELCGEMIEYMADYFLTLSRPMLQYVQFDFAYFFEDCCGNNGPLFSPSAYREYFHRHYVRMIEAYRAEGIPHFLIDSDGKADDLIPCWVESGFDILFPIEVGTWHGDPRAIRRQYGTALRMMGGVNKHIIPLGEAAIREHLEMLRPLAAAGGYLPIPDHRIPPDCSLDDFRLYVRVYREVFHGAQA